MKKSIVVLSPSNPRLVMRLLAELTNNGFKDDKQWNRKHNPNEGFNFLHIFKDMTMCYFSQESAYDLPLTESNYGEVLQTILNERL